MAVGAVMSTRTIDSAARVSLQECGGCGCDSLQWFMAEPFRQLTTTRGVFDIGSLVHTAFEWTSELQTRLAAPSSSVVLDLPSEALPETQLSAIAPLSAPASQIHPVGQFAGDIASLARALEGPDRVVNVLRSGRAFVSDPSLGTVYNFFADSARVIPSAYATCRVLNDRGIIELKPSSMDLFRTIFMGATFFLGVDGAARGISLMARGVDLRSKVQPIPPLAPAVGPAAAGLDPRINAASVVLIERNSAEGCRMIWSGLAKFLSAISYVAMAALVLISTLFIAIPNAALWILACTTSALVFNLISAFIDAASSASKAELGGGLEVALGGNKNFEASFERRAWL